LWKEYDACKADAQLQRLYRFQHAQAIRVVDTIRREYERETDKVARQAMLQRLYYLGDPVALAELLSQHEKRIKGCLKRYCRDDAAAVAEGFQNVALKLARYRTRTNYDYQTAWIPWALQCAHSVGVDRIRNKTKRPQNMPNELCDQSTDERLPAPDQNAERTEQVERIRHAVAALDRRDSEIVTMRMQGSTFEVIGERFGISVSWASRLFDKARQRIRDQIGDNIP
jgi:RNA polymerase sigma-70 factor (ECF subfamily)